MAIVMDYPAEIRETGAPPPGLLVTGYFKQRPPYHTLRRHGTRDWLLTFTLRGRGLYIQPGVQFFAEPGDLVLLEPGAYHDYGCAPNEGWAFTWAHFIPRPLWVAWLAFPPEGKGLRRLRVASEGARGAIRAAFLRCHHESEAGAGGLGEDLALNGLEEVLLRAAREQALVGGERALSPGVRRAVEHLAERLAEPHRIADLARLARLSPSRFAHRFKDETGDSAIAYLLKLRLRQAARLLEFSGRGVKEVAGDVGFECPFYFSRQFRKHYRMSPREYLKSRKGT